MPPKQKLAKEEVDPQPGSSTQPDEVKQSPKPGQSTQPKSSNPCVQYSSDSIEELSYEEIKIKVNQMHQEKKPADDIITFYLDRIDLTLQQTKSWFDLFSKCRRSQSCSGLNLYGEIDTEKNKRYVDAMFTEDFIKAAYEKYYDEELNRDLEKVDELVKKFQLLKDPEMRKMVEKCRRLVANRKKVIMQKHAEEKDAVIEVDKMDIQNMMFEAAGFMARKYYPKMEEVCKNIGKTDSPSPTGNYDSESSDFYPDKETKESKLLKMATSVDIPAGDKNFYNLLIKALPFCLDYQNAEDIYKFIDILKESQEIPFVDPDLNVRNTPKIRRRGSKAEIIQPSDDRETRPVREIIYTKAEVERMPSTNTLLDLEEIESDSTSSRSCSDAVRDRLNIESVCNEESQSISGFEYIDASDSGEQSEETSRSEAMEMQDNGRSEAAVPEVPQIEAQREAVEIPEVERPAAAEPEIPQMGAEPVQRPEPHNLFDLINQPLQIIQPLHPQRRSPSPLPEGSPCKKQK